MSHGADFTQGELEEARHYEVVINWSDADNVFVSRIPELEGVATDGNTIGEAAENALDLAASYIYGMRASGIAIPAPKHLAVAS